MGVRAWWGICRQGCRGSRPRAPRQTSRRHDGEALGRVGTELRVAAWTRGGGGTACLPLTVLRRPQHLLKCSFDVVKRWVNEAQEAASSDNIMVQVRREQSSGTSTSSARDLGLARQKWSSPWRCWGPLAGAGFNNLLSPDCGDAWGDNPGDHLGQFKSGAAYPLELKHSSTITS